MGKGKGKVLKAMASKPAATVVTVPSSDAKYDEHAEYAFYDEALKKRLRDKNPSAFDEYMATKSKIKLERLAQMRKNHDAVVKAGGSTKMSFLPTFQDAKNTPIPASFTQKLNEAEMREALGKKQYARFQELRKRKDLAGVVDGKIERSDFSDYSVADLNVEKTTSRDDGEGNRYFGKFEGVKVQPKTKLKNLMAKS